jgi:hypothetical protein
MNIIPLTQKEFRLLKLSHILEYEIEAVKKELHELVVEKLNDEDKELKLLKLKQKSNILLNKLESTKKELHEFEIRDLNEIEKYYLYVPTKYSKEVKKLGGIWDKIKKKWYTKNENENNQILIDIYHYNNFRNGILKFDCKTLQETIDLFNIYHSKFLA